MSTNNKNAMNGRRKTIDGVQESFMAEKVRRTKTKYKNIYYNESTKRYDVKYNFKEYDPITQKNRDKAKWKYNLRTISEAKEELA